MSEADETLAAPGEASDTTGGARGLDKSKRYWALIVCTHCRNYTSCRSVFTCYSKVAHHREVVLVDGEDARNKVAILVDDQPGLPSTEGRSLGEMVDLDVGPIDTGMKCTIGCQDCTGLPLKHCVDAGHVQQEICTDDLPLVSTRRAHAKLRIASKQASVDSRKTARTETDQVGNIKKRARQSISPRRTPATTRSKAKEEAGSTAAEPALGPSAKISVTPSVTRAVTPVRFCATSSATGVVTPSFHIGTPSATHVVTPSTGQMPTPSQRRVPNSRAKPSVASAMKPPPTAATKSVVTPPARPAPTVTPHATSPLPGPTVDPPSASSIAEAGSGSRMALPTVMIVGKKYVLPKCIFLEGNSFVVTLGWQQQEFLVNGVPSRPGRVRCKLPWAGGITLDNLTKTRAFRDAIWWEKTCTIHPLVAYNVAREQSMVLGGAHPGSIVRVILCRRGRDGRAQVFATTKGDVQQYGIEEEARISQLMSRIAENCPERPEACSASDACGGSISEGDVAAKASHTSGVVLGPSLATPPGSAAHLSSTVNLNGPHKRQLEGSSDIGTAVDDGSQNKRPRTESSDSPIEDDRGDRSDQSGCYSEDGLPPRNGENGILERSHEKQDMDCSDNRNPVEANGNGTATVHASFKASPVCSENLKPAEACGQGTPTAPASVRAPPLCSENLKPLQTNGHDTATPSASGRVPPICSESLKPAEANVLATATLPVSVRAPPRCSESLKAPEVNRHDTASAPAIFQESTVCAENLKHAELDEHGPAAAPAVLQAPSPSPSKLAEANNHGSAAVPAVLQASLACSENVKPAEANGHGTAFAPASVQTPPFCSKSTKPTEANGHDNATLAAFQATPVSEENLLAEVNGYGSTAVPGGVQAPPFCVVRVQFTGASGSDGLSAPMIVGLSKFRAENHEPTEANIHGTAIAPSDAPPPPLCSEKVKPAEANGHSAAGSAAFQTSHVCSNTLKLAEADVHCPAPAPVVLQAQPPCAEFLNPPEANLRSTATAPAVVQPPLYVPKSRHPTEANGHGTAAAPAAVQIAPLNPKNAKARDAMGPVTSAAPTVVQPSPQPPSGMDVETPIVFPDADREKGVEQSTRERVCGSDSHGAEEAELERVLASKQTPVAVANVQREDLAEKLSPAYGSFWPLMSCSSSSSASGHPTEANGHGTAAAPAAVQIAPLNPKNAKPEEAMGHVTSAAPTVDQPSPQPPSDMDVETPIVFSDADRERGVEDSTRERVCGSDDQAGNNWTKAGGVGPVVAVDSSDSHGAEEAELERVPASKQTPVAVANVQMEDLAEKLNPAYDPSWPFISRFPSSSASALNSVSVEANETRPVPSEAPPVASHGMCGGTLSGAERRVVSEIRVPFSRADGGSVSAQQRVDGNVVAAAAEGSYREERVTLRNAANEGAGSSGHRAVSPGKASTSPGGGGMKGLAAVEESESKIKRTMNQSLLNEPALVVELARFEECQRRELSEEKRQCREELAPLEAELEALKQRLRVRMRDAVERQAEELEIYRAALFGTIGSNVSPSPW